MSEEENANDGTQAIDYFGYEDDDGNGEVTAIEETIALLSDFPKFSRNRVLRTVCAYFDYKAE